MEGLKIKNYRLRMGEEIQNSEGIQENNKSAIFILYFGDCQELKSKFWNKFLIFYQ
jgi:hypothetical protein